MEKLSIIENAFGIDDAQYMFNLNDQNEVVAFELFDGEYDELPEIGDEIFEVLKAFPKLKIINIESQNVSIKTIEALSFFSQLKSITLSCNCMISDLAVLRSCIHLEYLFISGNNPIMHLEDLSSLTQLKNVDIFGSKVKDISPLQKLQHLNSIGLHGAKIRDISPIAMLSNLKSLNLGDNEIASLPNVLYLTNLVYLNLSGNNISDITPIASLTNLQSLSLSDNSILQVDALQFLSQLSVLNVADNKISSLAVLENHQNITNLAISNNPIEDVSFLNRMPQLAQLLMNQVCAKDATPLQFLINLNYLHASNCNWASIEFLKDLKKLAIVNISNNKIRDISVLENATALRQLEVQQNVITTIGLIPFLYKLEFVNLTDNPMGGKLFRQYAYEPTSLVDNLSTLIKIVAEKMFKEGKYEEALAYHYFTYLDVESYEIYVRKFCVTADDNWLQLQYYFDRVLSSQSSLESYGQSVTILNQQFLKKVNDLKSYLKPKFLEAIRLNARGFSFRMEEYYQILPEDFRSQHLLDAELYFILGGRFSVNKSSINRSLYYLKILRQKQSPFALVLDRKIRKCLDSNFAYQDRELHKKYTYTLENIDTVNIPKALLEYGDHNIYSATEKNRGKGNPSSSNWFFSIIIILIAMLIAYFLVYNNMFGMAGIVGMGVITVVLVRQMFK